MSSGSSISSTASLSERLDSISATSDDYLRLNDTDIIGQHYFFKMRATPSENSCSRNDKHASKPSAEEYEIQNHGEKSTVMVIKMTFQRMLRVLARCFIPCIKIKK